MKEMLTYEKEMKGEKLIASVNSLPPVVRLLLIYPMMVK